MRQMSLFFSREYRYSLSSFAKKVGLFRHGKNNTDQD